MEGRLGLRGPDGETWAQGLTTGVINDRDDHAEAEGDLDREGKEDGHQMAPSGNEDAAGTAGSNEGASGASGGGHGAAGALGGNAGVSDTAGDNEGTAGTSSGDDGALGGCDVVLGFGRGLRKYL